MKCQEKKFEIHFKTKDRFSHHAYLYPLEDMAIVHGTEVSFSSFLQSNIILDFKMFRPYHQSRDIICRNAHLMYQIWHRISFT
jgi:hypothetical protein